MGEISLDRRLHPQHTYLRQSEWEIPGKCKPFVQIVFIARSSNTVWMQYFSRHPMEAFWRRIPLPVSCLALPRRKYVESVDLAWLMAHRLNSTICLLNVSALGLQRAN